MSATEDRLRGATRWSQAVHCPRMASYGLLGVEPTPLTPREAGRMARGRDAGRYFARQMAAKHGEENVHFEFPVAWPAPPALPVGELHVDCAVLNERLAVEAKNTVWIDSLFEPAVLQVAGAVHFSDHFDSGLVVFLDHDYQITHEFPVFLNDELIEKIEAIAAAITEAGNTRKMPERVCEKPADARGHFCPFAEHCFEGWEPEPPRELPDLSELASRGWVIQRDLKAAKGNVAEMQKAWDEWKAEALDAIPHGETLAGAIRVKRSDRKGAETFSLSKAKKAGVWTPLHDEVFGPFVSIGTGSTTFDLVRTEAGTPLDIDYGEDTPF